MRRGIAFTAALLLAVAVLAACGTAEGKREEETVPVDPETNLLENEDGGEQSGAVKTEGSALVEADGENAGSGAANDSLKEPSGAVNAEDAANAAQTTSSAGDLPEEYQVFSGALFIGDSRTEGLSLYAGIQDADFFCAKSLSIDRIVSGEAVKVAGTPMTISELLDSRDYERVYVSLGLNELGWVHIEDFVNEYKTLIGMIREAQPEAVIYVEALLPVTAEKSDKGGTVNNNQIYWYNTHLLELAAETGASYINPDAGLVGEDGTLLAEATTDGVHLKSEYCKIWARQLAELSQE